jgi:exosome complex component RRP4
MSNTPGVVQDIDEDTRTAISRVTNIIRVLAGHSVPMTDTIIASAYDWALESQMEVKDILGEESGEALVFAVRMQT